jgi:hypothetical protein
MFAVFCDTFEGSELNGRGDTPQYAWEAMLTDFSIDEEDIDMDSVVFYRQTEDVKQVPIVQWIDRDSE